MGKNGTDIIDIKPDILETKANEIEARCEQITGIVLEKSAGAFVAAVEESARLIDTGAANLNELFVNISKTLLNTKETFVVGDTRNIVGGGGNG